MPFCCWLRLKLWKKLHHVHINVCSSSGLLCVSSLQLARRNQGQLTLTGGMEARRKGPVKRDTYPRRLPPFQLSSHSACQSPLATVPWSGARGQPLGREGASARHGGSGGRGARPGTTGPDRPGKTRGTGLGVL